MTEFVVFRFYRPDWDNTVAQLFPRYEVRQGTVGDEVMRRVGRPVPYVLVNREDGDQFAALRQGSTQLLKFWNFSGPI